MGTNDGINLSLFMHCLQQGQYIRIKLSGNSMNPTYKDGDYLILKIGNKNISVGDVVARYDKDHVITVHRIIQIKKMQNETIVKTKGDHNFRADSWCSVDSIIGVVVDESSSNIPSDYMY